MEEYLYTGCFHLELRVRMHFRKYFTQKNILFFFSRRWDGATRISKKAMYMWDKKRGVFMYWCVFSWVYRPISWTNLRAALLRAFAFLSSAVHSRDCLYFSIFTCNRRKNVTSSFRYYSTDDIAIFQESTLSYIKAPESLC